MIIGKFKISYLEIFLEFLDTVLLVYRGKKRESKHFFLIIKSRLLRTFGHLSRTVKQQV